MLDAGGMNSRREQGLLWHSSACPFFGASAGRMGRHTRGNTMIMKNRSMASIAAAFLAVLLSGAGTLAPAQDVKPPVAKMPKGQGGMKGMEGMKGMSGMMEGPHQALAMAYMHNLENFARTLQEQVLRSKSVDLVLARPATSEIRRSFDQMREHHDGHMKAMTEPMTSAMTAKMKNMGMHHTAMAEHITALESEVNANIPDYKRVADHAAAIRKECASMSGMAKPHQMR